VNNTQCVYSIRFLRREKELAESEKQATEAENNRLKQQLAIKTRELEDSTTALYEERAKNQVCFY
jgi:hypothetical protein